MKVNSVNNSQPTFKMKFTVDEKSIAEFANRQPAGSTIVKDLKSAIANATKKLEKLYPEYGDRLTLSGNVINKNNCEFLNLTSALKLTNSEINLREKDNLLKQKVDKFGKVYAKLPHVWLKFGDEVSNKELIGDKILERSEQLDIDMEKGKCLDYVY